MEEKPLVTIYLPTKNRLELLQRAVNSVLQQTYENIELIIIDDGSTDDTDMYLTDLISVDKRVVVHRNEESLGAPASRNIAITKASGLFVTGIDDDDEFLPDRVSLFVDEWQRLESRGQRPSCLYSNAIIRFSDKYCIITDRSIKVNSNDMFLQNCIGNQIFTLKENFISAGLFDIELPAWQDIEMFIRLLRLLGQGNLVSEPTYVVDNTQRMDRISLKNENNIKKACNYIIKKHAVTNKDKQNLLLQMYWLYSIAPTIKEILHFISIDLTPLSSIEIIIAYMKAKINYSKIKLLILNKLADRKKTLL